MVVVVGVVGAVVATGVVEVVVGAEGVAVEGDMVVGGTAVEIDDALVVVVVTGAETVVEVAIKLVVESGSKVEVGALPVVSAASDALNEYQIVTAAATKARTAMERRTRRLVGPTQNRSTG